MRVGASQSMSQSGFPAGRSLRTRDSDQVLADEGELLNSSPFTGMKSNGSMRTGIIALRVHESPAAAAAPCFGSRPGQAAFPVLSFELRRASVLPPSATPPRES